MDLRPNDIVFGADQSESYTIDEFIHHGGFGVVYKIHNNSDNAVFALKTITTASLDPLRLKALINEGKLATTIDHPNVLKYIFFHDGEQYANLPPYIIMEYADGGDLDGLINQRRTNNELFSMQEIEAVLLQLARGMQAINQKLIHRDIRPSNILLAGDTLKIADFGLSKIVGEATRSQTFKGIQHIAYMAPEAWRMNKNTIQMDIYSMGIVFYELSTLKHPYNVARDIDPLEAWRQAHFLQMPQAPDAINPSIPSYLAQTIIRMMKKRPEERYDSWDNIIERIQGSGTQATSQPLVNIQGLIQKARSVQQQRDTAQAQIEIVNEENKQRREIVVFRAEQLHDQIKQVVDEFNKQFGSPQLKASKIKQGGIHEDRLHILNILRPFLDIRGPGGDIRISIECLEKLLKKDQSGKWRGCEQMMFQKRPVWAWGYALARSGKGFNLLLVPNNESDLYGSWWILPIKHNPIAQRSDDRPDPFPFQGKNELNDFLPVIQALDIYQTEPAPFSPDPLISLMEEIV
jgi:serine/threonine protein kinase